MFGVDMFNGTSIQVNGMIISEGLSYPILLNGIGLIQGTENPQARDELFVVDRDGIIVFYEYYGIYDSWDIDPKPVENAIQVALNKPVTAITDINQKTIQTKKLSINYIAGEYLNLKYSSSLQAVLFLDIITIQGNIVKTIRAKNNSDTFNFKSNISKVLSGIYLISIRDKNKLISSHKILIQK